MAPKKKGKGSKLARMSDEERVRYLQHRAALEEEAKRRKEHLIATFMKMKLKKEEAFSRINAAKINQEWRQTLRVLKCNDLKQDLDALHFWFDQTANNKTQLIEHLLDDLQEAENQYVRLQQSHMEAIDTLLSIYHSRIRFLQGAFEEERDKMYMKARAEMEELLRSASSQKEHLNAIIFRQQQTADEKKERIISVHDVKIDELRNNALTELENVVNGREARMETLWSSIQAVLQKHWQETEDRRREYLNLRDTDADNYTYIFQCHQQINSLNDVLVGLKKQLANSYTEDDERVTECRAEKADCLELFHVLRRKLNMEMEMDHQRLCTMTNAAQNVTRSFEKTLSKSQLILQLWSLCIKLENADEKICPGGLNQLTSSEEEDDAKEFMSFQDPLAKEAYKKYSKLSGLWKRYNNVFIEKEALSLSCQSLLREQKEMKQILKKRFTEFAETQVLPKVPISIHRPMSTGSHRPKPIKGKQVIPRSGKIEKCSDDSHSPSYMHMLTIELRKPTLRPVL